MEKAQRNQLINQLEAVKGLITVAQGHMEDNKTPEAMEAIAKASEQLTEHSRALFANLKSGGRSTEAM